jgi:hypothetical protein
MLSQLIMSMTVAEKQISAGIESVMTENRVFSPPEGFTRHAHMHSMAQYRKLYDESVEHPEKFWAKMAQEELVWSAPWQQVLQWEEPFAKWFVGGQLNASYNCLDRHLNTPTANKAALIWEGEPAAPGKPGRGADPDLQTASLPGVSVRQRAQIEGHREGRSHPHLHADGPGSSGRDAGLRQNWCGPLGGFRRLQRAIGGGPDF